jgi:hypothetical protein
MFDINSVNKRHFNIKLNDLELNVEPPKVKTLKKIVGLAKNKDDENALSEAIGLILSKNQTGYKIPDEVIDDLDIDQYNSILIEFFKWLGEVRNSPN